MSDLINEFLELFLDLFSSIFTFIYDFIFVGSIDFISNLGNKVYSTFSNYVQSGSFLALILGLIIFIPLLKIVINIIRG